MHIRFEGISLTAHGMVKLQFNHQVDQDLSKVKTRRKSIHFSFVGAKMTTVNDLSSQGEKKMNIFKYHLYSRVRSDRWTHVS